MKQDLHQHLITAAYPLPNAVVSLVVMEMLNLEKYSCFGKNNVSIMFQE